VLDAHCVSGLITPLSIISDMPPPISFAPTKPSAAFFKYRSCAFSSEIYPFLFAANVQILLPAASSIEYQPLAAFATPPQMSLPTETVLSTALFTKSDSFFSAIYLTVK
jgi:hypothetical protein